MNSNKILLKEDKVFQYFLTSVEEEYLVGLREANRNKELDKYPNPHNINFKGIILQGDGQNLENINTCSKIVPYLEKYEWNTGGTKQVHYRHYGRTVENQERMAWLINMCPDVRMSWKSVLRKLSSRYCILWKKEK